MNRGPWPLTLAIWACGAVLLWAGWHWHPRNRWLDMAWGFAVSVATYFYILAFLPIRAWVERRQRRRPDE